MVKSLSISEEFSELAEFGHPVQQCVMPIIAIKGGVNGEVIFLGTGFIIGPNGHMMTAAHVVDEAERLWNKKSEEKYEINALYITNETHGSKNEYSFGGLIPITRMWHTPELDIAYLQLSQIINTESNEALTFPAMRLEVGNPKLKSQTLGFGYYQEEEFRSRGSPIKNLIVDYTHKTAFTRGVVTELYPDYKYKFPCFVVDSKVEPGMSGSPVMNEQGYVCGVICSSLPASREDEDHITFCSMVWPALGTSLEVTEDKVDGPVMKTVYQLAHEGYVQTSGLENLSINLTGKTVNIFLKS